MLELTSDVRIASHSNGVSVISLYTLMYHNPSSPLIPLYKYLTDYGEDILHLGIVYTATTMKRSDISIEKDGKIGDVTLSVGNLDEDRMIQKILEDFVIIGQTATMKEVFIGADGSVIGEVGDVSFIIKSATASTGQVDFSMSLGFDFILETLPSRKLFSKFCRWRKFKDEYCKYVGIDTECGKTFDDCKRKGNAINFGGCPSILSKRIYF